MTGNPVTIYESGMRFGPYPGDRVFHIEESSGYNTIKKGVKIAEFLLLQRTEEGSDLLQVVEAKKTSPCPETKPDFDEYIAEVCEKLVNGLYLGWAMHLGKHPHVHQELPKPFKESDLLKANVKLMLVIKESKYPWLKPVQRSMEKALHPTIKTWGLGALAVAVLNEEMAKKQRLII